MNPSRIVWRAICAIQGNPAFDKISKYIPSQIKKLIREKVNSSVTIKDFTAYIRKGVCYANSPEEKAKEMGATRDINLDERLFGYSIEHPYFLSKIAPFFPLLDELYQKSQGFTVIDVGCGRGIILNQILKRYPSARGIGVELAKEAVLMASRKSRGFYISGDAEDMPIKDEIADVVLLISVLHHFFKYPERILEETYRITKQGGVIIIVDPNVSSEDLNIHTKVQDITFHLETIYGIILDIFGERGETVTIPPEKSYVVYTERSIPPAILYEKLKTSGFSVIKQGYLNHVAFDSRKAPFAFNITCGIDALLSEIAPKEGSMVYFIAKKR